MYLGSGESLRADLPLQLWKRSGHLPLDTYRWTPTLSVGGIYDVYVQWTQASTRSTSVPITVCHANGCTTLTFNQQQNGGQWILHGQYAFDAGTSGHAQVTDQNGLAAADAVRFVPAP